MEDLYTTLGVSPNASDAEIRASYLGLIRRAHPDVDGGDEEWAKQVTSAYTILSDPKRRKEYDQREKAAQCPYCDQDLRRITDVDGHLYTHHIQEMADACEICGRKPTQTYSFTSNSGFIVARKVWGFDGRLCGVCSEGMFREFQARNITRGPWGIFSFFAAIWYLISNATGYYSKARQPPIPNDPAIDSRLRGRPIFGRPAVLVSLAIVGFIAYAMLGDLAESSTGSFDQIANTPINNTPVITQPPATFEQLDWQEGTCVTFSGDLVSLVSCSGINVDGQIVAMVSDADFCPLHAEWYVEVTFNEVACIETS
jgi:hypothetical protein